MIEASGETETPKPESKPIITIKRDEVIETDERLTDMLRQEKNKIEVTSDQRRTKRIKTEE